jgi:energy-coupling factor transport system permease protein
MLAAGIACSVAGLAFGGRRVHRTRYRPDPWWVAEWITACSGIAAAIAMIVVASQNPGAVNPSIFPPAWPTLPLLPTVAILVAVVPAFATPRPPSNAIVAAGPPAEARANASARGDAPEPVGAARSRIGSDA